MMMMLLMLRRNSLNLSLCTYCNIQHSMNLKLVYCNWILFQFIFFLPFFLFVVQILFPPVHSCLSLANPHITRNCISSPIVDDAYVKIFRQLSKYSTSTTTKSNGKRIQNSDSRNGEQNRQWEVAWRRGWVIDGVSRNSHFICRKSLYAN